MDACCIPRPKPPDVTFDPGVGAPGSNRIGQLHHNALFKWWQVFHEMQRSTIGKHQLTALARGRTPEPSGELPRRRRLGLIEE